MRKMAKDDNGKGTLLGFIATLVGILTVVALVCLAAPVSATDWGSEASNMLDKAASSWEGVKEKVKNTINNIEIELPFGGDVSVNDGSTGDKDYSFSLIDSLISGIEVKVDGDLDVLKDEISAQEQRIAELEAEVKTFKTLVAVATIMLVVAIAYLANLLLKLSGQFASAKQPKGGDTPNGVNLRKDDGEIYPPRR